jgi:hypothetical protein
MSILDPFRRFFHRVAESDEQRLADEIQTWAGSIPGTVRITEAASRERVRLAGVVKRITVHPEQGLEALEALLTDGTGELSVVWMGRRTIPGLTLGTHLVVEGVVSEQRTGIRRLVNPAFEFAS